MNGQVVCMVDTEQVRPGIRVGFTNITAGNLAFHVGDLPDQVASRRSALEGVLAPHGAAGTSLTYMNQVHGADVAVIAAGSAKQGPPGPGSARQENPTADAMVMAVPPGSGGGLAVMVADCVPVVLVGDAAGGSTLTAGSRLIAVAHAGRPGVEAGVIDAVVAGLRQSGATGIEAWLGPSVCGRCYEVPPAMREAVAHKVPEAFATTSWGTPALDLPSAVLAQLHHNGVPSHPSGICTLEDSRYYSHRRAQRDGEAEGRFIGFVHCSAQS